MDRDLRPPRGQALARAQIERHAGPAPVVDAELERGVGFDRGAGSDVLLLPVAWNGAAKHRTRPILAANRIFR